MDMELDNLTKDELNEAAQKVKDLVDFPAAEMQSNIPDQFIKPMDWLGDDFLEICVTFTEFNRLHFKEATLTNILKEQIEESSKGRRCHPMWFLLGEYSKTGNFHFHGMLSGCNGAMLAELKRRLSHNCGITRIAMVKYPDSYKNYVFKGWEELTKHYMVHNIEDWHHELADLEL